MDIEFNLDAIQVEYDLAIDEGMQIVDFFNWVYNQINEGNGNLIDKDGYNENIRKLLNIRDRIEQLKLLSDNKLVPSRRYVSEDDNELTDEKIINSVNFIGFSKKYK